MTPSPKALKGSQQCQDDCTGENFVRKRAVSQIDRKQWGTKRDLDRFYVNSVLQAQTALGSDANVTPYLSPSHCFNCFLDLSLSTSVSRLPPHLQLLD